MIITMAMARCRIWGLPPSPSQEAPLSTPAVWIIFRWDDAERVTMIKMIKMIKLCHDQVTGEEVRAGRPTLSRQASTASMTGEASNHQADHPHLPVFPPPTSSSSSLSLSSSSLRPCPVVSPAALNKTWFAHFCWRGFYFARKVYQRSPTLIPL